MIVKCAGCGKELDREKATRWGGELPDYLNNHRRYVCDNCLRGFEYWADHAAEYLEAMAGIRYQISNLAAWPVNVVMPDGSLGVVDVRAYTQGKVVEIMRSLGPASVKAAAQLENDLYEYDWDCNQVIDRAKTLAFVLENRRL